MVSISKIVALIITYFTFYVFFTLLYFTLQASNEYFLDITRSYIKHKESILTFCIFFELC